MELLDVGLALRGADVEVVELERRRPLRHHLVILVANQRAAIGRRERLLQHLLQFCDQHCKHLGDLGVADVFRFLELLLKLAAFLFGEAHSPGELLCGDHDALDAGRHLQRVVLHILAGAAENGMQEFLFRRQLGLALWGDLADEDVTRSHIRADPDDPALVKVVQRTLADVGDIPRELLATQLGVADLDVVFLDVDRGIDVIFHELLTDDDGILEVEAIPRHKTDQHVAAERQLTLVGGGTVGQHIALIDLLAELHDGLLVLARPLIEPDVFPKLVGIDGSGCRSHLDRFGVDVGNGALLGRPYDQP